MPVLKIEFVGTNATVTSNLKISKWTNAFSGTNAIFSPSFIDDDPDAFKVRITDPLKAGTSSIVAKLSTLGPKTSYNNPEVDLELTATFAGSGVFESATLILVSNAIDDQEIYDGDPCALSGVADDENGDRTFIAQLDGTVTAKYEVEGIGVMEIQSMVETRGTVNVNVMVLYNETGQTINNYDVAQQIATMKECYKQIGLKVVSNLAYIYDDMIPDTVAVGIQWDAKRDKGALNESVKDLLDRDAIVNEINIIYVYDLCHDAFDGGYHNTVSGMSIMQSNFFEDIGRYSYNIILSSTRPKPFTMPHEVGHLLTRKGAHESDPWNLMINGSCTYNDDINNAKRLISWQETRIYNDGHVYK